ncbi:GlxA family transcriptional regulator [Kitasatospora sp. NPDC057904]|uniref:GlxA family transcriptional regulator n=1 Tax=unclassified Kitasatospora TaxID=2633591 RepID=UPI0036DC2214
MRARDVLIVMFEGVVGLDVAGPLEVFTGANGYATRSPNASPDGPVYRVRTASPGGVPVRTTGGLRIHPDTALENAPPPHTLVVPGPSMAALGNLDRDVVQWLRLHAGEARRITSICSGAFLLAEAGLLHGRTATTHWAVAEALSAAYPGVTVDPTPVFVRDGKVSTSAGVTSGIDLALALVEEDIGPDAAHVVARYLVVFLRRQSNQRQLSTQMKAQAAHRTSLRDIQQWIADHPDADLSVEALARRTSLSPRHFTRAFTEQTGVSPGRYVTQTRLETARRLLEDTEDDMERVARAAGYHSYEAMRRSFQRALGLAPQQYRRQS